MDETIKMTLLVKLKVDALFAMCCACDWCQGDGIWTPCRITGAAQDPPCGTVAGPVAGKSRKVNLACLTTRPPQGAVCKDRGQLLTVECGGKDPSPFWVAPGKSYCFPPLSPNLPRPRLKRHLQCRQQRCYGQKDLAESSHGSAPYF